ncbi:MAG: hypothetical protein GY858_04185 [Candidatus Omnitrophica bacterium]|nr:hypothetical protein [Candidatus Omnitrophota bacterium]
MEATKINEINYKRQYYVGVTLLFASFENQCYEAVLESYIVNSTTKKDVLNEAKKIGEMQNIFDKSRNVYTFRYLGIHDIFSIIGPIKEGAILGRMTIWNITLESSNSLSKKKEDFSYNHQLNDYYGESYLSAPIFYVKADSLENSRAISCHVLVKSKEPSLVYRRALAVAKSDELKKKIVKSDFENLTPNELTFIGFEDILVIYDDIKNGGAFLKISCSYSSIEEIRELIIVDEELSGFFNYHTQVLEKISSYG